MDMRLLIVLAPLAIAASWAVFNIFRAALQQLQNFTSKQN
jgi:photosystem II PsbY protein